jgi:hypothetical protein
MHREETYSMSFHTQLFSSAMAALALAVAMSLSLAPSAAQAASNVKSASDNKTTNKTTTAKKPKKEKKAKGTKAGGVSFHEGSAETRAERERRLMRECKGRPNAGLCEGFARP